MTIDRLKSGSYRIRQMFKGKVYSVVIDHKPTAKEALKLLSDKMDSVVETRSMDSFEFYGQKYIDELEKGGKSPSTIRFYSSILKNMSADFKEKKLSDITSKDVQSEVDEYASTHSPKTVRNYNGYIHSVLAKYRPEFVCRTNIPTRIKKAEYEPTTEDVRRILEACTGSMYEITLRLCALGLRRGEAIAITVSDLDKNNVLSINKDIVMNKENKFVLKNTPKNESSNRRIAIPKTLADLIRKDKVAYEGYPNSVNTYLERLQKELGIPKFRLHMLRHFAAAFLHKKGFSDEQIMAYMGYESPGVMQRVYRYNLDPHESQSKITDAFDTL